ncbi:dihydroorotase [Candidatus Microgenomates bacterium]|nr:MAG: dihydroorotase [Candidatus Microgenomates bacterium]
MGVLTLPGLIDPHVHLRDLGQNEKEDFYTGTCAALAGGFTTILDMPNNKTPITTLEKLEEKIEIAKNKAVCDLGFYFGSLGNNLEEFEKVKNKVFGLKLYLNVTTGNFLVEQNCLTRIFSAWKKGLPIIPILIHGEGKTLEKVLEVLEKNPTPIHICHISLARELKEIIKAKEKGLPVTCGVTPHHLFLTENDFKKLGPFATMKPSLKSKEDVEFLWKNLNAIDVIESDHAPHTLEDKNNPIPSFGVPGLETTLPLLLTAVSQNRLTIDEIIRLCYTNPAKIFSLRPLGSSLEKETRIEVDLDKVYTIKNENLFTKVKWSPFNGWEVKGKVEKVFIRGTNVFENGKILVKPGFGKILIPQILTEI